MPGKAKADRLSELKQTSGRHRHNKPRDNNRPTARHPRRGTQARSSRTEIVYAGSAARVAFPLGKLGRQVSVFSVVGSDSFGANCRRMLKDTRMTLGRAFLSVHSVWDTAHVGCEPLLSQPASLNARFGPLQERYYLGQREHLTDDFLNVKKQGTDLVAKARALRR